MLHWLNNLPAQLGYGLATAAVLTVLAWAVSRARHRRWEWENDSPLARDQHDASATGSGVKGAPRVLPRAPRRFVNRQRELAALDQILEQATGASAPTVTVVSGMHGVGKSAIGRHWAHQNHARFPGGALTADFSRRRHPQGVSVSDVLADFLRQLGTSEVAMPTTLREKQLLFQRLTAERPILMLLDDVDQSAQALATLPAAPGSLVVVTSSYRLEELVREGARPLLLEPLDEHAAADLLAEFAGSERIDAEPDPARLVLTACAGLPIALCVCGARLAVNPGKPISWLAESLQSPARLALLSPEGEFDVSAVFGMAYDDLPAAAAELYRLLGIHPGPEFTVAAAAALLASNSEEVLPLLEQLEEAYLLEGDGAGRWRPHDLVREHMRFSARAEEEPANLDRAMARLIDWYTAAAQRADHAVVEDRLRLDSADPPQAEDLPQLRSPLQAFSWFDVERHNVLALQRAALERQHYERVWQIGEALWPLCASHKRFSEWLESQRLGIVAGEELKRLDVVARMRSQLARAHAELAEPEQAQAEMEQALAAAAAACNRELLASVIEFGGVCQLRAGDFCAALEAFGRARDSFAALGNQRGVALQDYHIGWSLLQAGDYSLALDPLSRAEQAMRRLDDHINVGRCLVRRGEALSKLARADEAREALTQAIDVLHSVGIAFEQAEAHEALAGIADVGGSTESARSHRQSAYRLYRELGHPRADVLLTLLEEST